MKKSFVGAGMMVLFLAVSVLAGCGGGGTNEGASANEALPGRGEGRVYGQVVVRSTRSPIADAAVTVYLDNVENVQGVSDANGNFSILNLPGGIHRLTVTKDGYAAYEEWVTIGDGNSYAAAGVNGKIELDLGCDATVYVVHNGAVVPNATVYADNNFNPEVTAVTDSTGMATLSALSQANYYTVAVPAFDSDGDGAYDYISASRNLNCFHDETPATIELAVAGRDDSIQIVDGSCDNYPWRSGSNCPLGASQSVVIVFNYPVEPAGSMAESLTYNDDLVVGRQNKVIDTAFVSSWSAGNTVLTLTPSAPLVENETYTLRGTLRAEINGFTSMTDFSTVGMNTWYVFRTAPLLISEVSADNYNGKIDHSTGTSTVYLKFPEAVGGRAFVSAKTADGVASAVSNVEINLGTGSFMAANDPAGCSTSACGTDGIVYAVSTGISLSDNTSTPGQQNDITVYIDAYDMDGNAISGELTLPTS